MFLPIPPPPIDDLVAVGGFQPASIVRFEADSGLPIGAPLVGPHAGVLGLTVGPDGLLYVASEANDRVLRYDLQTGAFVDAFVADDPTTPQDESGGLSDPTAVAFGPDGDLYVASFDRDRVLRYDGATGAFEAIVIPSNTGGLDGPDLGMAFGPDGYLYVPSYWNHRVKRFDPSTGAFLGDALGPGTSPLRNPREVLFLGDGTALVASEGNDRVLRFDPVTGVFLGTLVGDDPTTPGDESGGLDGPVALRLGIEAELLVTSIQSGAVKRYALRTGAFLGNLTAAGQAPALPSGLVVNARWSRTCPGTAGPLGVTAELSATGITSLLSDRLRLSVIDVPAGATLVFLVSDTPTGAPWLGGTLCVGGASTRLGPLAADGQGHASVRVPLRALGYAPGVTLHAQALYRDAAQVGGVGASSALALTLAP
jgi:hypothetical protein